MDDRRLLEVKNISTAFERKIVISSLSLCARKGEKIALIGPSGAGKTTLLNHIGNVLAPDEGEVIIDGIPVGKYESRRKLARKVGVMRQQYDLVGELPVIHNVLAGKFSRWSTARSIISLVIPQQLNIAMEALEKVGLPDKAHQKTSSLSGGEQQRIAIARLLLQSPELVLADEPVAALDPARAEMILDMLVGMAEENGTTLITVLHSVEYALKYFDRIVGLKDGRIHFDLKSDEVAHVHLEDLYAMGE